MSSKVRVAKCRQKKKENACKWKVYLEKDKLHKRAFREKEKSILKANANLSLKKKEKDRERQRRYRLKKKSGDVEDTGSAIGSYKSPRTLGKAVQRVKSVLPQSPSKKHAVVKRLIQENFGPEISNSIFKTKKSGSRQILKESRSVIEFYNNDEISRQAPGKRDVKSVKDPVTGKRGLIQIRHMVMGIGEAYQQFKNYIMFPMYAMLRTTLEWNFFASGHGKGAVDGVGGSIKRTVWREVQGRRAFVSTPYDFYKLAAEKCNGTSILFVPQSEVDMSETFLSIRWDSLVEIPGMQSMHHFQGYDENNIRISRTGIDLMLKVPIIKVEESSDDEPDNPSSPVTTTEMHNRCRYQDKCTDSSDNDPNEYEIKILQNFESSFEVAKDKIVPGCYVLVRLLSSKGNEYRYAAVCQSQVQPSGDVNVSFLKLYGQNQRKIFRTSEGDDKLVRLTDIVRILEDPEIKMVGDRVTYHFSNSIDVFDGKNNLQAS